jgi:hypothetical protein
VRARGGYRIIDEPTGSRLSQYAVKPFWPLLSLMFCGGLVAWPWFVLNGHALQSATRRRELAWAVAGLLGTSAIVGAGIWLFVWLGIPPRYVRYLMLVGIAWKLTAAYMIQASQERSADLHEYFGGTLRQGWAVLIGGFLLQSQLAIFVVESPLWMTVLAGLM